MTGSDNIRRYLRDHHYNTKENLEATVDLQKLVQFCEKIGEKVDNVLMYGEKEND